MSLVRNASKPHLSGTDWVPGHEDALVDLIRAGSEVANHGCMDRPYGGLPEAEFREAFLRAEPL